MTPVPTVQRPTFRRSGLVVLATAVLTACQPPVVGPTGTQAVTPGSAVRQVGRYTFTGSVMLDDRPLAGATVRIEMPTDFHRTLGTAVTTDRDGVFHLPIDIGPTAGQLMLLHASLNGRQLYRVLPAHQLQVMQDNGTALSIDLATTIAARRTVAKLIELQMGGVGLAQGPVRFDQFVTRGVELESRIRIWLDEVAPDGASDSLAQDMTRYGEDPSKTVMNRIIATVVTRGGFGALLTDWVGQLNDMLIANFSEEGPVFTPWTWSFDGLTVLPPSIRFLEDGTLRINAVTGLVIRIRPDRIAVGQAVPEAVAFSNRRMGNVEDGSGSAGWGDGAAFDENQVTPPTVLGSDPPPPPARSTPLPASPSPSSPPGGGGSGSSGRSGGGADASVDSAVVVIPGPAYTGPTEFQP